jgi:hypothetical protein
VRANTKIDKMSESVNKVSKEIEIKANNIVVVT